ncbi:keratinocyte proline-rich protein-like [Salvelinus alpinus]|uniref:keratinocyte proline-rich protein-like n=1 Tax=Salvelinus alpinus TaxID=8036 RepID=UPI0039FD2841
MLVSLKPLQLVAVMVLIVFTVISRCQKNERRAMTEHQLMHDRGRTMQSLKRLIWLSSPDPLLLPAVPRRPQPHPGLHPGPLPCPQPHPRLHPGPLPCPQPHPGLHPGPLPCPQPHPGLHPGPLPCPQPHPGLHPGPLPCPQPALLAISLGRPATSTRGQWRDF